MKQKIRRQREGPGNEGVGMEETSLWRSSRGPHAAHPCASQWLRGELPAQQGVTRGLSKLHKIGFFNNELTSILAAAVVL